MCNDRFLSPFLHFKQIHYVQQLGSYYSINGADFFTDQPFHFIKRSTLDEKDKVIFPFGGITGDHIIQEVKFRVDLVKAGFIHLNNHIG